MYRFKYARRFPLHILQEQSIKAIKIIYLYLQEGTW